MGFPFGPDPVREASDRDRKEREGEGGLEVSEMGREVAESCVDGVVMEMVSAYCNRFYSSQPELAARRIEAIGYQVGLQLSERYAYYPTFSSPPFPF